MAEDLKKSGTNKGKKPAGNRSALITLAVLAVLGWGWGIYQATDRSALEEEMNNRIQAATLERDEVAAALAALKTASGELSDIQSRIDTSSEDLAGLDERRQAATAEFEAELAALAERRAAAETQMSSELSKMTSEIETARKNFEAELGTLAERRDAALQKTEAAEASLGETRSQLEEANARLKSHRSELKEIQKKIAERQTSQEEAQGSLTKVTEELQTVGARLQEARQQESQLRETLSTLQEEAANLSKELAEAETRIQEARSAEAKLQETASQTSKKVAALEEQEKQLQSSVSELDARRSTLEEDVSTAEEQRTKVQSELSDVTALLKSRSDELLEVERRISEQQNTEGMKADKSEPVNKGIGATQEPKTKTESSTSKGEAASSGQGSIQPGTYRSGNLEAQFSTEGTFRMRNDEKGAEASGQYSVNEGVLTLSNPEGDVRKGVSFPLRCAVTSEAGAFVLNEAGDEGTSCGPLAGVTFEGMPE